ncbi:hypothetical protein H5410_057793, partial [Solanum commersonii]
SIYIITLFLYSSLYSSSFYDKPILSIYFLRYFKIFWLDMEIEVTSSSSDIEKGVIHSQGVAYLVWEDLTVMLPNFGQGPTKKLLHGLSGYAEPGRIMAIMGPSGSGKSTLLDTLAGRLSTNVVMTGNILLNGKKRRLDYGVVAYVTQEDTLLGTLTPRETIMYSAHLRLPTSMTKEEVDDIVEGTIMEMGLGDCADRLVGNWQVRGISGGEKKRLSIALEILVRPRILFLDEPTTGLDSASAFFVVQALKNISRDGRTVISSIHQPSSEVFALFDDLFLLSGGEAVYFGEAKLAVQFFAESGFPCPSRRNPSDHFLRCVNSDFDVVTATLKGSQRLRLAIDSLQVSGFRLVDGSFVKHWQSLQHMFTAFPKTQCYINGKFYVKHARGVT